VKEKNMTESNEKSSTSKAYEGGSNGSSPNQKALLNQFEQQFLSNCHKTPPPNNNHGDMAPQSLPQFVQMSQDLSQSTHQVHLPDIDRPSNHRPQRNASSFIGSAKHTHNKSHQLCDMGQNALGLIGSPKSKRQITLPQSGQVSGLSNNPSAAHT
jgi:hypothetical protein